MTSRLKVRTGPLPGAAYFNPALVVDGYKVHFADAMANDGDTEVLGQGFNGARSRCFIGRTIDNKLGLATINGKYMTIMQGAYVLADLGWTDVYYVLVVTTIRQIHSSLQSSSTVL